jgi:hypothetical protein
MQTQAQINAIPSCACVFYACRAWIITIQLVCNLYLFISRIIKKGPSDDTEVF